MAVSAQTTNRVSEGQIVMSATVSAQNDNVDFQMPRVRTITLQLTGTIGAANVALHCSNDGTNYVAVPTAVAFTATGVKAVPADGLGFRFYRLTVTTGAPGGALVLTAVGVEDR